MMQEIGSGTNYRISIDKTKNRLYVWAMGDMVSPKGVEGILPTARTACKALKPGFTTLVDFLEVKLFGLPDLVQEMQEAVLAEGMDRLASVWDRETFSKMVVDSAAQKAAGGQYATKRQVFHTRPEAEAWLDK